MTVFDKVILNLLQQLLCLCLYKGCKKIKSHPQVSLLGIFHWNAVIKQGQPLFLRKIPDYCLGNDLVLFPAKQVMLNLFQHLLRFCFYKE